MGRDARRPLCYSSTVSDGLWAGWSGPRSTPTYSRTAEVRHEPTPNFSGVMPVKRHALKADLSIDEVAYRRRLRWLVETRGVTGVWRLLVFPPTLFMWGPAEAADGYPPLLRSGRGHRLAHHRSSTRPPRALATLPRPWPSSPKSPASLASRTGQMTSWPSSGIFEPCMPPGDPWPCCHRSRCL